MVALAPSPTPHADARFRETAVNLRSPLATGDEDFHVIENVPIFPEHQTQAKDGRWLVFDYEALKAVCIACNRRIEATGDYAAITLGHTVDPALVRSGKARNPPIVGFAGPFTMGLLGKKNYEKWCILARFRIFRDKWPEVRTFPRRSPELWLMDTYDQMFLDPIALLGAETPRVDMGLLYSAELHSGGLNGVLVEKYAAASASPSATSVFVPSERYQGESAMPASTDEIVQAVVEALDSLDWVQFTKQQMQAATAPAAQGTAPAADVNAPPPPPPEMAAAGGPPGAAPAPPAAGDQPAAPAGGTPPATPVADPPAASAPAAAAPPPVEQRSQTEPEQNVARVKYSADDDELEVQEPPEGTLVDDDDEDDVEPEEGESVEQYRARSRDHRRKRRGGKVNYSATADVHASLREVVQAAVAPLAQQVAALDSRYASDRAAMKNIERYARLESLARQGYTIDPAELSEKLKYSANADQSVSDAEFERSIEILTKTGNRAPIDAPLLPIPAGVEQYSAQPGSAKAASPEQRDTTRSLCEKAAMDGLRPDYAATLHNVVSGKTEVVLN